MRPSVTAVITARQPRRTVTSAPADSASFDPEACEPGARPPSDPPPKRLASRTGQHAAGRGLSERLRTLPVLPAAVLATGVWWVLMASGAAARLQAALVYGGSGGDGYAGSGGEGAGGISSTASRLLRSLPQGGVRTLQPAARPMAPAIGGAAAAAADLSSSPSSAPQPAGPCLPWLGVRLGGCASAGAAAPPFPHPFASAVAAQHSPEPAAPRLGMPQAMGAALQQAQGAADQAARPPDTSVRCRRSSICDWDRACGGDGLGCVVGAGERQARVRDAIRWTWKGYR